MLSYSPKDICTYTLIMMASNSAGYILNFFYTQKYVPVRFTRNVKLKVHLKPVMYLFCTTVALTIYIKSDITILGFLRSDREVGIYTLASRIYMIVKALLNAVITAATPRLVNCLGRNDMGEYNSLLSIFRSGLYVLVFPAIVGLHFLAPDIMLLLGGKSFLSGYESLRILCGALLFAVFGCFYAQGILVPLRKEKIFFYATLISAAVNITGNIVIIPLWGMNGAAITTITAEAIVCLICRFFSLRYTDMERNSGLRSVVLGCIAIGIACKVVSILKMGLIPKITLSIFASVVLYVAVLGISRNVFIIRVFSAIRDKT